NSENWWNWWNWCSCESVFGTLEHTHFTGYRLLGLLSLPPSLSTASAARTGSWIALDRTPVRISICQIQPSISFSLSLPVCLVSPFSHTHTTKISDPVPICRATGQFSRRLSVWPTNPIHPPTIHNALLSLTSLPVPYLLLLQSPTTSRFTSICRFILI